MNKRKMLEDVLRKSSANPLDAVLPISEWKHVLWRDFPYMQISEDFAGMVLVARWVRTDLVKEISRDDMVDMLVGSDGRTKN